MEQRDLLQDQIEQLGKVLAKIMADFLRLKANGNAAVGIETSNELMKGQLDINIDQLITLDKSELQEYLNQRKLTESHLEMLSDYLKEIGIEKKKRNQALAEQYFNKAIELLTIADETSKTLSFERMNKKSEIEKFIEQN